MAAFAGQGIDTIKGLVELAHQFSHFNAVQNSGFSPITLWEHSRRVSRLAGWIAREEVEEDAARLCGTAGLLHDIGKVAIAANLPRKFNEAQFYARVNKVSLWLAEQQQFGATHSEVGGWMTCVWGLPLSVVEAVMLHHHPSRQTSRRFTPLTAVHVANGIARAASLSDAADQLDMDYLDSLRLRHRLPHWWETCRARDEEERSGVVA
jgi:putative nucleotidyltransferase with HDIG domain